MASPISVNVKVAPFLQKYLYGKSENYEEPLVFCNKNPITNHLTSLVSNYNKLKFMNVQDREAVFLYLNQRYTTCATVSILLPWHKKKDPRVYNYLSFLKMQEFIRELKNEFYVELYEFMRTRVIHGTERKKIIEQFLQIYDITEDDIKFETVYRQTVRIFEPFRN